MVVNSNLLRRIARHCLLLIRARNAVAYGGFRFSNHIYRSERNHFRMKSSSYMRNSYDFLFPSNVLQIYSFDIVTGTVKIESNEGEEEDRKEPYSKIGSRENATVSVSFMSMRVMRGNDLWRTGVPVCNLNKSNFSHDLWREINYILPRYLFRCQTIYVHPVGLKS